MKHFITGCELSKKELLGIVDEALAIKKGKRKVPQHDGIIATLLFANPSLRTRLSCTSAISKMGGSSQVMGLGDAWVIEHAENIIMNGSAQEHIKEAAPVISGFCDIIGLRRCSLATRSISSTSREASFDTYKEGDIFYEKLAEYAKVPVINLESNMYHPCQGLADLMTMKEFKGNLTGKKVVLTWAPHPKALPLATPHSQLLMPSLAGMNVTLAHPEGFDLADEVLEIAKMSASSLTIEYDQKKALEGADIVIAKSWAKRDYFTGGKINYIENYSEWQMTMEKMMLTNDGIFLHCLPVRRNVVASDDLLDSSFAKHIEAAENRMWAQIALMDFLLKEAGK